MRDPGLTEAINAAGGVTELARRIGISQPSVTNWDRVPADRIAAVEQATGVARMRLRPDLYGEIAMASDVDEIDRARAQEYALLAALLIRAPDAELLRRLTRLAGDDTPLGRAHQELAKAAEDTSAAKLEREYFELFIGVGRGELLPYGSYYLTGFLQERPLARLREDLAALGVERVEDNLEPEDHAATLCEIMAAVVGGKFPAPEGSDRMLFEKHMAPWMGRLFADLERAEAATFYRHVGSLGRAFMDIETEAFALPA
jgi:TorA maturation chaperone TorD